MDQDIGAVFLDKEGHAEECIYRPVSDEAYTVNGIFDAEYKEVTPQGSASVSSIGPQLLIEEKALRKKCSRKDTVTVRGIRYVIKDSQPDGTGCLTLFLAESFAEE
jgi:hypothetical protein